MNFSSSNQNLHNRSKFNWSSMTGSNDGSSSPLFAPGLSSGPSVLNSSVKIRMAFLRKVYTILSVQLLLTTAVSALIMITPAIQRIVLGNIWMLLVTVIANIGVTFALMTKRNEYPMNFYLLGVFTLLNSVSVGSIVSLYDLSIVIQAVFLTGAIVVGLTLYTFNSKSDLTWLNSILFSTLTVMTMGSLVHLFVGNNFTHTVLTALGAFIFSLYIIYDTQMIMKHLSADEYIVAVINLYVDIINLFVRILRLLDQLKNEESRKEKRRR